MHEDPAVARVREVRQRISRQFDNDPKKLVEHYMQLQEKHKDRFRVDDQLQVEVSEPEAQLYTVKPGDSLSGIAKVYYGDAMKYPVIFEANQPIFDALHSRKGKTELEEAGVLPK